MGLKFSFSRAAKKAGIALSACFLAASLTGCGPSPQHLGDMAKDPGLHGSAAITMVYKDAAPEKVLTVDAHALKAESRYVYDGSLVVKGDVPANTEIDVSNGKLVVTGDVGSGDRLDVQLPVITHDETNIVLMPMSMSCGTNCTTTYLMPMPVTSTVEDGLAHPNDPGPAVKVVGAIGNKVTIKTNGGIQAGSWGTEFKARTGYGRPLQQVPPPARPAAPSS